MPTQHGRLAVMLTWTPSVNSHHSLHSHADQPFTKWTWVSQWSSSPEVTETKFLCIHYRHPFWCQRGEWRTRPILPSMTNQLQLLREWTGSVLTIGGAIHKSRCWSVSELYWQHLVMTDVPWQVHSLGQSSRGKYWYVWSYPVFLITQCGTCQSKPPCQKSAQSM